MKTAVVFSDGIKQIILTPENDDERFALKLITTNDNIELAINAGSFGENYHKPFAATIGMCQGGYLRTFSDEHSIMLVLKPKKENT